MEHINVKHVLKLLAIVVPVFLIGYFLEVAIDELGVPPLMLNTIEIISDLLSVFVALSIFSLTWSAYSKSKDNHSLLLGSTFLLIGILILFHILSYPFMPQFITLNSMHKAAFFLIESHLVLAVLFLASVYVYKDTLPKLINKYIMIFLTIILSIIFLVFTITYHDYVFNHNLGMLGLILQEIGNDHSPGYIFLMAMSTGTILYANYLYARRAKEIGQNNLISLIDGSVILVFSNLVHFSYEFSGHFLEITGFYFIYLALYKSSVELPYEKLALAEEKLRRVSEDKYHNLFENANDAIITTDPDDRITSWNRSAEKIFGWGEQEVIGRKLSPLIVPDDLREKRQQFAHNALTGTGITEIETVRLHKDGSRIDISLIVSPLLDTDKKIIGLSEIFRDIRERKKMEKEMRRREFELNESQRVAHIGSWDWNAITDTITWSPEYYRIYDIDPKLPTPNYLEHLKIYTSESAKRLDAAVVKAMQTGEPYELELELVNSDENRRWIFAKGEAKHDTNGQIVGLRGIAQNITKRKQVDEKLQLFRNLLDQSNDAIFVNDPETGRILDANDRACVNLGYKREEILNMRVLDFEVRLPDQFSWKEHVKEVQNKGYLFLEGRHRRKNGITFPVEVNVSFIVLGKISYMVAVVRDITERKQADEALRESEEKYRVLMNDARDAIILADMEGKIVEANKKAEELTGYTKNELLNMDIIQLHPKEELESIIVAFNEDMKNGSGALNDVPILRKDGKIVPVDLTGNTVEFAGKRVGQAMFRDITERKQAEEQIRQSLKEKEILLREIHHRVKNNLQIVSSLLAHQAEYIKDKNVIDMFTESQNRILSMSLVHEKLYQSNDLAKIDFHCYINDLVAGLFQSYEINAGKIKLNMHIENLQLDIDFAIPCGLIINELVTNSLKYAFPDNTEGEINIAFLKTDENMLELVISDNGIGLPKDLDFRKTESLGLHLVTILSENQLHGEINLNRSKGTEFQIKFRGIK